MDRPHKDYESENGFEILMSKHAGFCNGVKRAIEIAERSGVKAREMGTNAVTLGALVHNDSVVSHLEKLGISPAVNLECIRDKVLIIPSHGLEPEVCERAREIASDVIDATCPHVIKVQKAVEDLSENGYTVIVVGDKQHPEVRGVAAHGKENVFVVSSADEVDNIVTKDANLAVVSQTTQSRELFQSVVERIKRVHGLEVKGIDTICPATRLRQEAAIDLSRRVELMVVIGGRNSANTKRLSEVCKAAGAEVIQIETADQLKASQLEGVKRVGVTAGASTPDWVIEEVVKTMADILNDGIEKKNQDVEDDMTMEEALAAFGNRPRTDETEVVEAIVTAIFDDRILVDIGTGSDATVMADQLAVRQLSHPSDIVKIGDKINVVVGGWDKKNDTRLASKRKADAMLIWDKLEEAKENKETIKGVVSQVVKGGLVVDIGTRAFVPASQIDRRFVEDLNSFLKKELDFRIIDVEREKNNVILSRRVLLEEAEKVAREKIFETLKEGDVVDGKVSRLTDFGAFVDIGDGVEGLLHISDIAWSRITHPSKVLSEGQDIKVKVLNVDTEKGRISLGYKQLQMDPWDAAEEKYPVGSIVNGTVMRIAPFGAFVKLEDGVEGLVHISQLSDKRVNKVEDVLSVGQEIPVKILDVKAKDHKISLSFRQAVEETEEKVNTEVVEDSGEGVIEQEPQSTIADTIDPEKLKNLLND